MTPFLSCLRKGEKKWEKKAQEKVIHVITLRFCGKGKRRGKPSISALTLSGKKETGGERVS